MKKDSIVHSYPFCWRSHTPLIYRTIPSWYVRVEQNRDLLIEKTLQTEWVPTSIKDGRFIEWLKGARDWSISRSRYWGTPIPIWTDEEYSEFVVVDSVETLEKLTGKTGINDIHRHFIDDLEITSPTTGKKLKRIPDVFDCWFESGSMPFSQDHIPFSGKEWTQADFIAEGLDQTRGWFYTLTILSVLLGHSLPFKHNIVNGLILAKDGKKMSKSQKNYPDPVSVINNYGADAVRLYLVNSPAVHAEPMRFDEEGVKLVVKDVMLPWLNSLQFFLQQVGRHGNDFKRDEAAAYASTNVLDIWILSKLHRVLKYVHDEMEKYHLYSVLPELVKFIDDVTKWYVRLNRTRMKTGEDAKVALSVLFEVLYAYSVNMGPYTPFFSEFAYQKLKPALPVDQQVESVHYLMIPAFDESKVNKAVERKVSFMQSTIFIARNVRDRKALPVKRPLLSLLVVCSEEIKGQLQEFLPYIVEEVHVMNVNFDTDEKKYVRFNAQPDGRALGKKLRGKLKEVITALPNVPYEEMSVLYDKSIQCKLQELPPPEYEICGCTINTNEMNISRTIIPPDNANLVGGVDGEIVAFADISDNDLIKDITTARFIRSVIQQCRKENNLMPTDKISKAVLNIPPDILRVSKSEDPLLKGIIGVPFSVSFEEEAPGEREKVIEKTGLPKMVSLKLFLE